MTIDLTQALKTVKGDTIKDESGNPLTLRDIIITALNAPDATLKEGSGKEKLRRFHLAENVWKAEKEITLSSEDVVLIKTVIDRTYPSSLIVGQAWEMIEPTMKPAAS
jgi:hypothetical protein